MLVIALQAKSLPVLGTVYILAVFMYHYRQGIMKLALTTVVWYWITTTVSLFVWLRYNLWIAAWLHVFVAWFAPLILASVMPFSNPAAQHRYHQ